MLADRPWAGAERTARRPCGCGGTSEQIQAGVRPRGRDGSVRHHHLAAGSVRRGVESSRPGRGRDLGRGRRPGAAGPGGRPVDTWREGYPYGERLSRLDYEVIKRLLQIELLKLQAHVKD